MQTTDYTRTKIILESAKTRLYNETRVIGCLGKKDWLDEKQVKDFPNKLMCPVCGTTSIGVFDRTRNDVGRWQAWERQKSKKEPPYWWIRGKDMSKLISLYGRRAGIIASAKNVDLQEAWDILAEAEDESDNFFMRIVDAEREALKKRFV